MESTLPELTRACSSGFSWFFTTSQAQGEEDVKRSRAFTQAELKLTASHGFHDVSGNLQHSASSASISSNKVDERFHVDGSRCSDFHLTERTIADDDPQRYVGCSLLRVAQSSVVDIGFESGYSLIVAPDIREPFVWFMRVTEQKNKVVNVGGCQRV